MAFLMVSSAAAGLCARTAEVHPIKPMDKTKVARRRRYHCWEQRLGSKGENNMDSQTQWKVDYFIGRNLGLPWF
jgi:hypothetical protein